MPIPLVLCSAASAPILPPIVIASNRNSITVSFTKTGTKLGEPTPAVLTDQNGNVITQSGFSYSSLADAPYPIVLTDVNGNPITLTIAT